MMKNRNFLTEKGSGGSMGRTKKKAIAWTASVAGALIVAGLGWALGAADRSAVDKPHNREASIQSEKDAGLDRIVMVFPAGSVPKDLPLVEDVMNKYLKKKIGAVVDLRPIDLGGWWDKTGLMFASNEQIDLMFTAGWMRYGDEVAKGRFIPLDDLLERYGAGIRSMLNPSIVEAGKINDHIYGIVANKEFASSKGLVMRKDLVEKYGIDLSKIKKLSDMTEAYRTIKRNEPGIAPLQAKSDRSPFIFMTQNGSFDMLGEGPGVLERAGDSTKVVNMAETSVYMEYAKLMYEWNRLGFFNADATTTQDSEYEAVKAGQAFSYAESLKPGFDIQASRDTGMPMAMVELTRPYTTTADTTSAMFGITKNAKHPEKAMRLLDLLYTDPYLLNLLDWGIEGIHYVKTADNLIAYPDGVDARTVGYNLNEPWMFGNQFNSYLWANEDPNLWVEYRSFNEKADKSKALGFVFNPAKVKNEIAACNLVEKEFAPAINTGAMDPELIIPKYVEKLKAAGADKIIREKQRQLDEWLARGGGR
ncbi:sugar ABC transporter substrate-binding protein [Cohnella xylanilytica]|uniref:ABC transporter substrate-binding protein n=1 Tax=Cohnella xylanilytica TaxID=557555 RepID=A0A841U2A0_9BACL|nr:ABC transporter substrate-binding protein [Cohnella xylanilytica]MBB6693899.1 ABC transporter substrate-binding protein [Cohnella xylanilytica]GIO15716.1 sugar ABC transporter substrate-binding protein [Cohnella xylanilytica]